jgi:hypothetical protein
VFVATGDEGEDNGDDLVDGEEEGEENECAWRACRWVSPITEDSAAISIFFCE